MNTATYIKEVNNTPVLFNIDNARDMANFEALQAIKMPENMANEIFGNNTRYADNTTCIITEIQVMRNFRSMCNLTPRKLWQNRKRINC